jgi:hypothetical protein
MAIILCVPALPPLRRNWNIGADQVNLQDALHRREVHLHGRHDEGDLMPACLQPGYSAPQAIASMDGVASATKHPFLESQWSSHSFIFLADLFFSFTS